MSRSIVVTGGAGFIGSHIVEALVARGDRVRVLDNLATGKSEYLEAVHDRIEFIQGDILDHALLGKVLSDAEIVYHQAALASVPLSVERPLDVNAACVTGTLNVLDQARRTGVRRVIYAASSSLYGDPPFASNRENDLPAPLSPYAVAKLGGEHYCHAFYRTYGLETVCLRYFNVFGPRQDPASPYSAVIPLFITALLAGQPPTIFGDGEQSRDFAYVGNIVDANLLAAEAPAADVAGRSFNIANGRSTSLLEMLRQLQGLLGTQLEPQHAPPRAGEVRHSQADISEARRYLRYEPRVDFATGLRLSIQYYRTQLSARSHSTKARDS